MGLVRGGLNGGLLSGCAVAGVVWGLSSSILQVALALFSGGACVVPPSSCPAYLRLLSLPTRGGAYKLLVFPSVVVDYLFRLVLDDLVSTALFVFMGGLVGLFVGLGFVFVFTTLLRWFK